MKWAFLIKARYATPLTQEVGVAARRELSGLSNGNEFNV